MKSIWKWLFAGLLIAVLTAGIIVSVVHAGLHEPGVNISGNHAVVSLKEDCYFIDSGEITGKSTFSMEGYLWDRGKNMMHDFYGYLNLPDYPAIQGDSVENFTGCIENGNYLLLTNTGITLIREDWEYYYTVHIYESNPDLIFVAITHRDGRTVTAICAESEEAALENYRAYVSKSSG